MAYIEGEQRGQHTLFPTTLDELIPQDHVCRVIEAFVDRLDMAKLGFFRSEPAETGRPGYDPRDLLKLYLYGYLWQIRSSRRLETKCQRNVEVMWLLGRLVPDYKSDCGVSADASRGGDRGWRRTGPFRAFCGLGTWRVGRD
jgi:transposase